MRGLEGAMRAAGAALAMVLALGAADPAAAESGLEFIGEVTFPTGYQFQGTEVGGLSGIDYNKNLGVYYAISDDRSQIDPARFYTLKIDLSDGQLDAGDVSFRHVTTILDTTGEPFAALGVDPESIRWDPTNGHLLWSSEGDANALVAPFVREMTQSGGFVRQMQIPGNFLPTADHSYGIRNNLALESLSLQSNPKWLWTATENALYQDGPATSTTESSPVRVVQYVRGPAGFSTNSLFIYPVDPVADEPVPAGSFATNGLVEIIALGGGKFLTMERSFSTGVGNVIRLYVADLTGATVVTNTWSIEGKTVTPMHKRLLANLADFGITPDNVEGITFGPLLPDGRRSLILCSDNNFSATQVTQFLAFAVAAVAFDD